MRQYGPAVAGVAFWAGVLTTADYCTLRDALERADALERRQRALSKPSPALQRAIDRARANAHARALLPWRIGAELGASGIESDEESGAAPAAKAAAEH